MTRYLLILLLCVESLAVTPTQRVLLMSGNKAKSLSLTDYYLLYDDFSIVTAAGSVNATQPTYNHTTNSVGGPRTVTDTESKLSVTSSNTLYFSGGKASPAMSDPSLWYAGQTRVAGKTLICSASSANNLGLYTGWTTATSGSVSNDTLRLSNIGLDVRIANVSVSIGSYSLYSSVTTYETLRSIGSFEFFKSGTYPVLVWISKLSTSETLYPNINNWSGITFSTLARIPRALYIPSPLISDSFTRADGAIGSTDGLGHLEQNGGGSLPYIPNTDWAIVSNKAWMTNATQTNGILINTNLSTANALIDVAFSRGALGFCAGIIANYDVATGTNYLRAYYDGNGVANVDAYVNGNKTNYITGAITYADNATLRLITVPSSGEVRCYYNNAIVGSAKTSGVWPGFTNFTSCGLFSTSTNASFTNFVVWARGNEGQYAGLDNLGPVYSIDAITPPSGFVLSEPDHNDSFLSNSVITLSSMVIKGTGDITNVSYYANSNLLVSVSSAPFASSFTTNAGTYYIHATCMDTYGLSDTTSVATITVTNGAAPTYLVEEDCEGTGTPAGWTDFGGGTVDWDYTTTVLEGSHSLYMTYSASKTGTQFDFADKGEVWIKLKFRMNLLPGAGRTVLEICNGATPLVYLQIRSTGILRMYGPDLADTVDAMAINTDYFIWFHHKKGSGDGMSEVSFSATDSRPTTGNAYATVTSQTQASDSNRLILSIGGTGVNPIWDLIQLDDAAW